MLFADDTTLFASHSDPQLALSAVNKLLVIASQSFKENNNLSLNGSNTQPLTFSLTNRFNFPILLIKLLGFVLGGHLV